MMKRLFLSLLFSYLFVNAQATVVHQVLQPMKTLSQGSIGDQVVIDNTTFGMAYDWQTGGFGLWENSFSIANIMVDQWDLITFFRAGDTLTTSHPLNVDGYSWTSGPQNETPGIHYVGVKTMNDNYAWIKIEVRSNSNGWFIDILEYAYEDNGGAIVAGSTTSISSNVSINELEASVDFDLSVDPNRQVITIEAKESHFNTSLFDLSGRLVHQSESQTEIATGDLDSGYYIVHILAKGAAHREKVYIE